MPTRPFASIIIVNWNKRDYLEECVRSLLKQTFKDFEIIVVDNNSTDGSQAMLREKFPSIRLVESRENLGFAKGCALGLKHAKGRNIALFNNDAVADKSWLAALAKEINSGAAIAGGKVIDKKTRKVASTWIKMDPVRAIPYLYTKEKPRAEVDYVTGCAVLMSGDAVRELGFLDTGYFMYYDDPDWCARAIRAGKKVAYAPDAIVWHDESSTLGRFSSSRKYHLLRSRIRFALKNFDLWHLLLFSAYFKFESAKAILLGRQRYDQVPDRVTELRLRLSAIAWNALNLPATISARGRDSARIKNAKSYNESLPLLNEKWSPGM